MKSKQDKYMKCEHCKIEFLEKPGKYATGRFCTRVCANKFASSVNRELRNKKISDTFRCKVEQGTYRRPPTEGRDSRKTANCLLCQKEFKNYPSQIKKYCSMTCVREAVRLGQLKTGGFRKNSGRSKSGYYKGIWCQSSYELAFVVHSLDHGLVVERCTERFKYTLDGVVHEYCPDFVIGDAIYEIKGYDNGSTSLKIQSVVESKRKIFLLGKKEIEPLIQEVRNTHKVRSILELFSNAPSYHYTCAYCKKEFCCVQRKRKSKTGHAFCSQVCSGKFLHSY